MRRVAFRRLSLLGAFWLCGPQQRVQEAQQQQELQREKKLEQVKQAEKQAEKQRQHEAARQKQTQRQDQRQHVYEAQRELQKRLENTDTHLMFAVDFSGSSRELHNKDDSPYAAVLELLRAAMSFVPKSPSHFSAFAFGEEDHLEAPWLCKPGQCLSHEAFMEAYRSFRPGASAPATCLCSSAMHLQRQLKAGRMRFWKRSDPFVVLVVVTDEFSLCGLQKELQDFETKPAAVFVILLDTYWGDSTKERLISLREQLPNTLDFVLYKPNLKEAQEQEAQERSCLDSYVQLINRARAKPLSR